MSASLARTTKTLIREVFGRLDYKTLSGIYCYEGGEEFWRAKRKTCQRLGIKLAESLLCRLKPGGRSLYVGAGVAELPLVVAELVELRRVVEPYNLRRDEVAVLNQSCHGLRVKFRKCDASSARGMYDHLWIVSVLNDPERFPHLAPLSYGEADPVTFDPVRFEQERRIVQGIVNQCMPKLALPGLVTTSREEVVWIAEWCHRHRIHYRTDGNEYPTALVGDPICFIRIGGKEVNSRKVSEL